MKASIASIMTGIIHNGWPRTSPVFFISVREELIKDFGDGWKKFHSTMDWVWLAGDILGLILAGNQRLTDIVALVTFWGCVLVFVYIPKWVG